MSKAAYQKQRRHKIKARLIEQLGSQCVRCEQTYPLECFDFHHTDPRSKSFEINQNTLGANPWDKILTEASKCVLVCSNCHRSIHANNEEDYFENTYMRHRNGQSDPEDDQGSLFIYWQ